MYAEQNPLADGRLQIMTIHKAKGLEFDTVILLGLARKPPTTKHKLLLWMEFPEKKNSNPFILAPISAASSETTDPIYRYLQDQNTKKDRHESARLLYVAASRAKSALHLIATLAPPSKSKTFSPAIGSLLQHLWPILNQEVLASLEGSQPLNHPETTVTETLLPQTLQRLKANWVWHSSTVI